VKGNWRTLYPSNKKDNGVGDCGRNLWEETELFYIDYSNSIV